MVQLDEIVANFKKTFLLADIESESLAFVAILFEDDGPKIYKHLPVGRPWFSENIEKFFLSGEASCLLSDESLEREFTRDSMDTEIVVARSCRISDRPFCAILALTIEQVEFRLFATAICRALIEAVSDHRILSPHFSPDNLCRTASRNVMQEVMGIEPVTSQSLSILLDHIAFLPYEDQKTYGSIVFSNASSIVVQEVIHLREPVNFLNIRGVRKLLEIGKDKFCLLASEDGVYGFGLSLDGFQDVVRVDFRSDNSWVLTSNGRRIYRVRAGLPMVFRSKMETHTFYQRLKTTFPGMSPQEMENLLNLLLTAVNQSNGTNILVVRDAGRLSQRLKSQCTLIDPVKLTSDMLAYISRIDGTVLIEPDGTCVAFGAILDGLATNKGDSSRGGRFNSAVMFCESSDKPCLIVVVSQDGTVDIVSSAKTDS